MYDIRHDLLVMLFTFQRIHFGARVHSSFSCFLIFLIYSFSPPPRNASRFCRVWQLIL